MDAAASIVIGLAMLSLAAADAPVAPVADPARFRIEAPPRVLSDVPTSRIVISALTPEGALDKNYHGQPLITGIRLSLATSSDVKLGSFENGVLELSTDLTQNRKVFVTEPEIVVEPDGRQPVVQPIRIINRWWSIVPLLLAVGCALWLRNAVVPLVVAVVGGAMIIAGGPIHGLRDLIETYLVGELFHVSTPGGQWDRTHVEILLGTVFLAAAAGVMAASGSLTAFASKFERVSRDRSQGQLFIIATALFGFFDATINTLVRGPLLRPIGDRLQISREKQAFLLDVTASSLAGLVVATTWIGFEYALVRDVYARLGYNDAVLLTMFATIPFRFYPVYLLMLAGMIAWLGNDFGPMRRAEARTIADGSLLRSDSVKALEAAELPAPVGRRELAANALLPVAVLLAFLAIGIWWTGSRTTASTKSTTDLMLHWITSASVTRVMMFAAFAASAACILFTVATRSLSIAESMAAWLSGARTMLQPLVLLMLAWGFARVCDPNHLNTAGFLMEVAPTGVSASSIPALAFLLASLIAFATGSNWTAAGLLLPIFLSITHAMLADIEEAAPLHYLMLATIGAVFTGGLFGSQCSLVSLNAILASAGAASDHYDHIVTQTPYALTAGGLALLLGYFPAASGLSPAILLPMGTLAIFAIVQFAGRSPSAADAPVAAEAASLSFTAELDAVLEESEKKKKRA